MSKPISTPKKLYGCVFCQKIKGMKLHWSTSVVNFEPLNPVTKGHLLVVPRKHVRNFGVSRDITEMVMAEARRLALNIPSYNIITSKGEDATQSVFHYHVHIVPRRRGDGLKLPWSKYE